MANTDDLVCKINDLVNKKPITPEDELQDSLDEMARDIALIEPDPVDWAGWVSYLLAQLEWETLRRGKCDNYEKMLRSLRKHLDT